MIDFPSGFDAVQFANDIYTLAAPFISVMMLIVAFVFIIKAFNKVGR